MEKRLPKEGDLLSFCMKTPFASSDLVPEAVSCCCPTNAMMKAQFLITTVAEFAGNLHGLWFVHNSKAATCHNVANVSFCNPLAPARFEE